MKITDGQKFALAKLISNFSKTRHERLWILSELLKRKIETTADAEKAEWRLIRDWAYPNWHEDDWQISEDFKEECNHLSMRYEREVIGQKQLFGVFED